MGHAAWLRLRIYTSEAAEAGGKSLYPELVRRAHESRLAGVTVFRGIEGFGPRRTLRTARLLDLSPDLPVVVEVVDREGVIQQFLEQNEWLLGHAALVTVEPVSVWLGAPGRGSTGE